MYDAAKLSFKLRFHANVNEASPLFDVIKINSAFTVP
jgi:hypothetical protein